MRTGYSAGKRERRGGDRGKCRGRDRRRDIGENREETAFDF